MSEQVDIKLEGYEGPLDLLLSLIEKNKYNIFDIPIVEITEQYLDYLDKMEESDMNIMSEFLVMAATLTSRVSLFQRKLRRYMRISIRQSLSEILPWQS